MKSAFCGDKIDTGVYRQKLNIKNVKVAFTKPTFVFEGRDLSTRKGGY